jgi:hypothetical protein
MRLLMILFVVGLASVTTTGSALAQNTLIRTSGLNPRGPKSSPRFGPIFDASVTETGNG